MVGFLKVSNVRKEYIGGGVDGGEPAQLRTVPHLEPRRVGSFLLSYVLSDRAAAGLWEPVMRGKDDSTVFARKNL